MESRLADIVGERVDAGVRLAESVDKAMIAVRIGPDLWMALVAAPSCAAKHGVPQEQQDLFRHAWINFRMLTLGNLYAWEFVHGGHPFNIRVDGPMTFNAPGLCLQAARAGFGFAFVPRTHLRNHAGRRRKRWCLTVQRCLADRAANRVAGKVRVSIRLGCQALPWSRTSVAMAGCVSDRPSATPRRSASLRF